MNEIQSRFCLSTILHSPINKLPRWNKKFRDLGLPPSGFSCWLGEKRENFSSSSSFPLRFTCSCEWTHQDEDEIIRPDWFLPYSHGQSPSLILFPFVFSYLRCCPSVSPSFILLTVEPWRQSRPQPERTPPQNKEARVPLDSWVAQLVRRRSGGTEENRKKIKRNKNFLSTKPNKKKKIKIKNPLAKRQSEWTWRNWWRELDRGTIFFFLLKCFDSGSSFIIIAWLFWHRRPTSRTSASVRMRPDCLTCWVRRLVSARTVQRFPLVMNFSSGLDTRSDVDPRFLHRLHRRIR